MTFNGKKWYIIEDNSTAVDKGTVTLLAADSLGTSKYSDSDSHYSSSTVKKVLDEMTKSGGSFGRAAYAIETIQSLTTPNYSGNGVFDTASNVKLYLLSEKEAENVPKI